MLLSVVGQIGRVALPLYLSMAAVYFPALMPVALLCNGFGAMATSGLIGLGQSRIVLRAGLLGAACTAFLSPVPVGRGIAFRQAGNL
jgi:O-antigen/teichoic acid export membrane protein